PALQKDRDVLGFDGGEYILMRIRPNAKAYRLHAWLALGEDGVFGNTPMAVFLFAPIGVLFMLFDYFLVGSGVGFWVGLAAAAAGVAGHVVWGAFNASHYKRYEIIVTNERIIELVKSKTAVNAAGEKVRNANGGIRKGDMRYRPSLGSLKTMEIYQNFFAKLSGTYCLKCFGNAENIWIRYIAKEEADTVIRIHKSRGKKLAKTAADSYKKVYGEELPAGRE
ncbi:MAG: hypothetical protein LBL66_02260, partial [Clostridiales bacterium]|nr:hypothetical protein [Clostridiales bacterium]